MNRKNIRRIIFIALLLSPIFILMLLGKDNVYAMATSVSVFFTVLFLALLTEGISANTSLLWQGSSLRRWIKESTIDRANVIFRALLIIAALGIFWIDLIPIYGDTYMLFVMNEKKSIDCIVTNAEFDGGLVGIHVTQWIDIEHPEIKHLKKYFTRRRFEKNQKYHFVILPRSGIVLSSNEVE